MPITSVLQFIVSIVFVTYWKGACRLRTSLCLQFKSHHIAAGAIFLAGKFLKVKLPSDAERLWWKEFDVTARQLEGQYLYEYCSSYKLLDLNIHLCICKISFHRFLFYFSKNTRFYNDKD